MGRQLATIRTYAANYATTPPTYTLDSATANAATLTDTIVTPSWARYATFFLNMTTVSGTTKTVDLAFSYLDPVDITTAVAYPGSGITQITAAGLVVVTFDPVAADDDTGPIYTLHGPVIPRIKAVTILGTKSENEIQTLSLTAGLVSETFKLTYNAHESTAAVTLPTGGYANVTAAQIKTCLLTISDFSTKTADIAVVKSTNDYIITFSGTLGNADIGAITVTSKTGAADGSVAETNKGVVGDEVYAGTLSVVYSAV